MERLAAKEVEYDVKKKEDKKITDIIEIPEDLMELIKGGWGRYPDTWEPWD